MERFLTDLLRVLGMFAVWYFLFSYLVMGIFLTGILSITPNPSLKQKGVAFAIWGGSFVTFPMLLFAPILILPPLGREDLVSKVHEGKPPDF